MRGLARCHRRGLKKRVHPSVTRQVEVLMAPPHALRRAGDCLADAAGIRRQQGGDDAEVSRDSAGELEPGVARRLVPQLFCHGLRSPRACLDHNVSPHHNCSFAETSRLPSRTAIDHYLTLL